MTEDSCFKGSYSGSVDLELKGNFEGSLNVRSLYIKKSDMVQNISSLNNLIRLNKS
jgi:cytoskeletal protein CcmA (bactofilin family)